MCSPCACAGLASRSSRRVSALLTIIATSLVGIVASALDLDFLPEPSSSVQGSRQVLRGPARHLRAPTPCSSSSAAVDTCSALIELVASSLVGFCAASLVSPVSPVSLLHPKRLPCSSAPTPASSRQNLRRLHPSGIAGHQPLRAAAYPCDLVRTSRVHACDLAPVIVQHIRV